MISDWYQALLDVRVTPEQSRERAIELTSHLAQIGLITLYSENFTQTHMTGKFAPGPKIETHCGHAASHAHYHIGGMDVHTGSWVNDYGIIGLEAAQCPICGSEFSYSNFDDLAILRIRFGQAGQIFKAQHQMSQDLHVTCPACQARIAPADWQCTPHLGFCSLAFTFWNWPPFEDWKLDITDLFSRILGYKPVMTYGKL